MILQFKVKNYLSIREEQTLDFTASADKTYEEYAVVKIKNVRISKLGVIYGPNASGKSNLLKALVWLGFLVFFDRPPHSKGFVESSAQKHFRYGTDTFPDGCGQPKPALLFYADILYRRHPL